MGYDPPEEKKLLLNLRDYLVAGGYSQTDIVKTYQNKGERSSEISKRCLYESDLKKICTYKNWKKVGPSKRIGLGCGFTFIQIKNRPLYCI